MYMARRLHATNFVNCKKKVLSLVEFVAITTNLRGICLVELIVLQEKRDNTHTHTDVTHHTNQTYPSASG